MGVAELTLFAPGLLPTALLEQDSRELAGLMQTPVLDTWLSRGKVIASPCADTSYEHQLFALFGGQLPTDEDVPVAALRHHRLGRGAGRPWCICADPVHLRADINNLVLFDARQRVGDRQQQDAWLPAVRQRLQEEGLALHDAGNGCWYLLAEEPSDLVTHSLSTVQGQPLGERLPAGPDRARWLRLMNEIQMTLNQSQTPDAAFNSLWFWGSGRLPPLPAGSFDRVWADDVFASDLGLAGSCQIGNLEDGRLLFRDAGARQLVVVTSLLDLQAGAGLDSWMQDILQLQSDWLEPLQAALRQGGLDAVTLVDGHRAWRVTRHSLWRWWRRKRFFLHCA